MIALRRIAGALAKRLVGDNAMFNPELAAVALEAALLADKEESMNAYQDGDVWRCNVCRCQIDPTFTSKRCLPFCQRPEHRTAA